MSLDANITSKIFIFWWFKLLWEQTSEGELADPDFDFADRIFVFELALFCTSIFQLLTDFYNHRSRCHFKEKLYFLNDSTVCSELFFVLILVLGLLNICTRNVVTIKKPETHFSCEFATERFFQKTLLSANVKLSLSCCHCAVWAWTRRQYLIWTLVECLISKLMVSISQNSSFFSKNCLVYIDAHFTCNCYPTWFSNYPKTLFKNLNYADRTMSISAANCVRCDILRKVSVLKQCETYFNCFTTWFSAHANFLKQTNDLL